MIHNEQRNVTQIRAKPDSLVACCCQETCSWKKLKSAVKYLCSASTLTREYVQLPKNNPSEEHNNVHDFMLLNESDAAETFGERLRGSAVTFKGLNQPSCTAADELKTHGWIVAVRLAPEHPFV